MNIFLWQILLCLILNFQFSQSTTTISSLQSKLAVKISSEPKLFGYKSSSDFVKWSYGVNEIPINMDVDMQLYGNRMINVQYVSFTTVNSSASQTCDLYRTTVAFRVREQTENYASVKLKIKSTHMDRPLYYFCLSVNINGSLSNKQKWIFQGTLTHLTFKTYEKKSLLPLWLQIIMIIILFTLSGLFSGLNLGLMSLNLTELNIIEQAGSPNERRYAKIIKPVRKKGNFLLCTLLLGNVLVNNTLAILMDDLTGSGLMAVIVSTVGIVVLGEIIPQAICSRHSLCIGAKTIWITKFFMLLTGVASYPISLLLNVILGKELGQVYNREKLNILVKEQQVHGSVVKAEAQIISGALTLTTKTVRDIMTPLCDVFMIASSSVLDFNTMNDIVRNGFTRVPIYECDRASIKAVLNVKDLAFIDPDDRIPVTTVCQFYNRSILVVDEATNLRSMLEDFRQGKAHMAFVERMDSEGDGDPFRETIGLVTLEDVIEEIIQAEIMDETDVITDNVRKHRRLLHNQDFSVFNIPETGKYPRLSPQLKVAALRHLSSNVKFFGEDFITSQILQSLLNANIVIEHTYKAGDDAVNAVYKVGQPADYAVLILQGKVNVVVSNENLLFEAGPFVLFGEKLFEKTLQNLPSDECILGSQDSVGPLIAEISTRCTFTPDYTATASCNLQYLKITAKHYLFARILSINGVSASKSGTGGGGAGPPGAGSAQQQHQSPGAAGETLTPAAMAQSGNSPVAPVGIGRTKRSLTLASLQQRDLYQTQWEKLVEPPSEQTTTASGMLMMNNNNDTAVLSADDDQLQPMLVVNGREFDPDVEKV